MNMTDFAHDGNIHHNDVYISEPWISWPAMLCYKIDHETPDFDKDKID